ncbi:uncharacterized protein LOC109504509 [Harpegnathos saltator]|uniref:uncharacterized protein LOC109504509 n=1 Tax=Harpegnathos saltator TaxID=610380 RepID=UPI000948951E|nr:uncharacterized protein LOC109504509 [Harpegnathos saltator]
MVCLRAEEGLFVNRQCSRITYLPPREYGHYGLLSSVHYRKSLLRRCQPKRRRDVVGRFELIHHVREALLYKSAHKLHSRCARIFSVSKGNVYNFLVLFRAVSTNEALDTDK